VQEKNPFQLGKKFFCRKNGEKKTENELFVLIFLLDALALHFLLSISLLLGHHVCWQVSQYISSSSSSQHL